MSLFISFSSKDRKYVFEFLLEAKNQKIPAWAAVKREAEVGKDFVKLISRKIGKSSGSILLISNNSINSRFINEKEIPQIITRSQHSRKYKIIPLVIDDVNFKDHPLLGNVELFNSESTSLNSLSGRKYEAEIKSAINEFSYIRKKRMLRVIALTIVSLVSIFVLVSNAQRSMLNEAIETTEIENSEYDEGLSPGNAVFNEEQYIKKIRSTEVESGIGKATLISDEDFIDAGLFVCETIDQGVPAYLVYDTMSFRVRSSLLELGLTGGEGGDVPPESMDILINSIFNASNEIACSETGDTTLMIEKAALLSYLTYDYEFRSIELNKLFKEDWIDVAYRLDTGSKLEEYNFTTITLLELQLNLFLSICEYDLSDVDSWLDTMQSIISDSTTEEDQNYQLDVFDISFRLSPYILCPNQINDASFLATALYALNYNFEPKFSP